MQLEKLDVLNRIISRIESYGYEAYVVGGAIRDEILKKPIEDFDFTTNASLDELKIIFKDSKIVEYKKGSTIGVSLKGKYYEISSFFGHTLKDDLMNRDFTINAMAYHPSKGLIDPLGGRTAIEKGIIQPVKSAEHSIMPDPIRMLRAIRFSAKYNFQISKDLEDYFQAHSDLILSCSKERIAKELNQILISKQPSIFIRKYKEIFFKIIPDLELSYQMNQHSKWHHLDVLEHILCVLDHTKPILVLRLAALFHDIAKPQCFTQDKNGVGHFYNHYTKSADVSKRVLSEYKYPLEIIQRVYHLVLFHDRPLEMKREILLKFLYEFGTSDLDLFFNLKAADISAQNPLLLYRIDEMKRIESYTYQLIETDIYSIEQLELKRRDLVEMGYPIKNISKVLSTLLIKVIDKKLENKKEILLDFVLKKQI